MFLIAVILAVIHLHLIFTRAIAPILQGYLEETQSSIGRPEPLCGATPSVNQCIKFHIMKAHRGHVE
jgi:hypothetical protein